MKERLINEAKYILKNKTTIRETAKYFNTSKTTIHNDLTKKLPAVNYRLYKKVKKLLLKNFNEKHIRGGISTKNKYLLKNNQN